jgi:O-acetylhomoserine/O-acetylserine sulfhydrylase-like pyridoxal-dependent enzyme
LGFSAGFNVMTAHNVICIGASGEDVDNTTWIGNIYGTGTQSGTTLPVIVSDNGQLGTAASSRRFKKDIQPMDKTSESILALKPVTFHYKTDTKGIAQFGLVAEEVAEVNRDLVVRDKEGKPYAVRYEQVNAMLLNEFLKEHRKVEEQSREILEQRTTITELKSSVVQQQKGLQTVTARLEDQAAQIQKVSAQLEASKPAPQMVNNP